VRFATLLLLFCFSLYGQDIHIPPLSSPVVDEANFLKPDEKITLSKLCHQIFELGGPQVTILTVNNLQGLSIEDFSIRVAEKWQLGTRDKDNGIIILVSKEERKVRIEIGNGIEGEITDFESNRIIKNKLTPNFKQGLFFKGFEDSLFSIAEKFNLKISDHYQKSYRTRSHVIKNHKFGTFLPFAILALVFIHLFFSRNKMLRGLFSGLSISGLGYLLIPGIGLGIGIIFLLGMILGLIGLNNLLYMLASNGHSGGGFSSGNHHSSWGGSGGGSWSGGGGGFSGGGSSGDW
jgi:uncharacterized protein